MDTQLDPTTIPVAFRRVARRRERGMTLLEIMIVLAILALVMGLVVGPRLMNSFKDAKIDTAKAKAQNIAGAAFLQWSMKHPDKQCPDKLEDLGDYMDAKDTKDPWGNNFKMLCGQNLPAGAKNFAVMSSGPDGKDGTDDDIKSWE